MMSSVTEARRELEELAQRMQTMERQLPRVRSLLMDITTLANLTGMKEASDIQRRISLLYQAKAAYDAFQVARLAAGDPFAWISVGVTAATTTIHVVDELEMRSPEY